MPFSANSRAKTIGKFKRYGVIVLDSTFNGYSFFMPLSNKTDDYEGMVKVISDAKTDRILGAHIIGPVSIIFTWYLCG